MGYAQKLPAHISAADYLLLEERSLDKHEYLDGVIYEWQQGGPGGMAGGSKTHNRCTLNLYAALKPQLRVGRCSAFVANVKITVGDDSAFFYPDLVVTCSEADRASERLVKEPCLIVEVLSESTELFDRRAKFEAYRRIASLESYVLVSPKRHMVEVHTRSGHWARTAQTEAVRPMFSDTIELGTHGWTLDTAAVFEDVRFGDAV